MSIQALDTTGTILIALSVLFFIGCVILLISLRKTPKAEEIPVKRESKEPKKKPVAALKEAETVALKANTEGQTDVLRHSERFENVFGIKTTQAGTERILA